MFPSSGPRHHTNTYIDEPATPTQLVAAIRGCTAGLFAQLDIDPAAHGGGLGPRTTD